MVRTILARAFAAALVAAPVQAQDNVRDIVGGIAREYLQQEQDRAAFSQAQNTNTLSAYQSYLRQFPNGMYAAQARDRVERLGGATSRPETPSAADTASLTAQQRLEIQRRLNALGYETNGVDGSFGPGTRRAIALWQRDRNYSQTGALNAAQANEILRGTTSGSRSDSADSARGPAQVEAALNLSRQQRSAVQAGLTRRGFDTRGVDGVFGQGTRNAIAAWQRANDESVTGYLTGAQAERLIAR
ncbi:peptidoglycan-binding protein (plasmid) [Paracoccus denitrificans]|uniref:peptidoglycan-binding domain-containing protein n=1 Tax=Paracoccus denitrificans TaxID=266 RepID=UPI001E4284D2|nr:peptidoglycan-binding protein [Paracoccus denitrificans]UFS68449.1 peptidoglycan-binding protein [Paracoccus denitrificans]